ncbi:chromosome partitioning protein, ParB family [Jannaschia faecimaris]|uniref:Chromosome partitioning protein, ParB family n=1 Tax=Jannaschia faecimaris TaxID=1244108 RepID=A0A1H3TBE6_9RHOB|nr:ParB/RepB/Spo0J family partition protein [Jannaschia faecimaris]SDZ47566.1 chromosome partitioning protein, ParB family [Jannaschia faecimaris]
MSRKRRIFDVDLPEDPAEVPEEVETKSARRGPMASAIGEVGDARRYREKMEADIRAENDALAHELVRLKKLGLVTDLVPLDAVRTTKLTRDRRISDRLDLADLKTSLREIGLSNPIRVEADGAGGYELVQGLRRLTAYRELLAETEDDCWAQIPAGILAAGQSDAGLYRRMVDENLIRKDVSFAEMAQLARAYAADHVDGCTSVDDAVNALFASVAPQKRSYIRRFALVMAGLEKVLDHPSAMSRSVGLALADRLEADATFVGTVSDALRVKPERDAATELAILRQVVEGHAAPLPTKKRGAPKGRSGRVALSVPVGPGVRATATQGKMELRAEVDFGAVDRTRLEKAIEAFWREIEADT